MKCILLCLFVCLGVTCSLPIAAQVDKSDTTLNVIAYFNKGDSASYKYVHSDYRIVGRDTVYSEITGRTFLLTVVDSTASSYRLCYELQDFSSEDSLKDKFKSYIAACTAQVLKGKKVYFITDQYGTVERIENWKAIGKETTRLLHGLMDKYLEAHPKQAEALQKEALKAAVTAQFSTEEGVRESFKEMGVLFGLHGRSYKLGKEITERTEASEEEQETVLTLYADTLKELDVYESDGYFVRLRTDITVPAKMAIEAGTAIMGKMISEEMMQKGKSELEQFGKIEDFVVTMDVDNDYFYSGWGKSLQTRKITDLQQGTIDISQDYVEFLRVNQKY